MGPTLPPVPTRWRRRQVDPLVWFGLAASAVIVGIVVLIVMALKGSFGDLSVSGLFSGPDGGASPEEVFRTAQEAVVRKDIKTCMKMLSPDIQSKISGMAATFMLEAARLDSDARSLLTRHGVDVDAALKESGGPGAIDPNAGLGPSGVGGIFKQMGEKGQRLAASIRDKPQFLADMMAMAQKKTGRTQGNYSMPGFDGSEKFADAKLTDVVIEGNSAHAQVSGPGRPSKPIYFELVNGRWYISAGPAGTSFF